MDVNETEATIYKLKRFTSSSDKEFIKALRIYLDNTDLHIITNTNEISYGLDFYNNKHSDSDFTAVGLYMNRVLIGYCQFVYFKEEKLVFIDYLVIDKKYRKNNTFYEFIEKIKEYFAAKNYHPFYLVAEVSLQGAESEEQSSGRTKNLIRLLKMSNFGLINSPYFQPMLGMINYESNLQAVLMLYPADEHKNIKKETFIMILKTIYFKHYGRWYKMFLNEKEFMDYTEHLHQLFSKVNEKLKNTTSISLNSYNDLSDERTVSNPRKSPKKILYFITGFLGLIILIAGISYLLRFTLGMEYKDQFYFLGFVSFAYLVILSIVSDKASGLLNKAIEKLIDKLT